MTDVAPELLADLRSVLSRCTGKPDVDFAAPPVALTGGFWAQLVAFRLAEAPPGWSGEMVARVMPDPATATKETAFQRAVSAQGYPTPRVHAAGGPGDGIAGQAYLVMDHVAGRPLLAGLDGARALAVLPSLVRRLPAVLADALARLHRLNPGPARAELDTAGVPQPTLTSFLHHVRDAASAFGRTDLAAAADALTTRTPADEPVVVCHGDMHPFNVLVDDTGAFTVLDWSAALLGPATYDVGFTALLLSEPPLLVPRALRPLVRGAGRWLSRRFVAAYEHLSGRTVDGDVVAWHQAVICLRALTEVASWVAAGTIGERGGHPWVMTSEALAVRLRATTGVAVRAR